MDNKVFCIGMFNTGTTSIGRVLKKYINRNCKWNDSTPGVPTNLDLRRTKNGVP